MSQIRLTDPWLRAPQNPGVYTDALVPCLKVRIGSRGEKLFSAVTRKNGRPVRATFGRYPSVTLAEARRRADAFQRSHWTEDEEGSETARIEIEAATPGELPVSVMFNDYVARMRRRGQKAARQYEAAFTRGDRSFCTFLKRRYGRVPSAPEVTADDATAWLRQRAAQAEYHATYLRTYLHAAFKWGLQQRHDFSGDGRDYGLAFNPISALPTGRKPPPRDRVLSLDELKAVWSAFSMTATCHRVLALIIAMGGVRVSEICATERAWWSDDMLKLPRTKNGRAHALPITETAKPILALSLALADRDSPFLFPNGFDAEKSLTLAAVSKAARLLSMELEMEPFSPRDLRRTMKTHLIERGVDERWLDVWHNHGQNADVARKHYVRAEYAEVKRQVAVEIDAFLVDIPSA